MSEQTSASTENVESPKTTLRSFLESVHPSIEKEVDSFWRKISYSGGSSYRRIRWPDIRLHCKVCNGERTFRCPSETDILLQNLSVDTHPTYTCGDCNDFSKLYALHIGFKGQDGGTAYKFGEYPPFGIPVPNKVLRLFGGQDSKIFLKGRQCENLGYGIGAFAYYRRVVENHKNDLFDAIIGVCETVGTSADLVEELKAAKTEISFSKSLDRIKTGLPQGLLINGHNPLNALHGALSVGIHNESDEDCLAAAQAVRLVLSDLVERIALLRHDNKQLHDAVQLLLSKRG